MKMFLPQSLDYVILYINTVIKRGVYKNLKNQMNLSLRRSAYHSPAGGFISKALGCAPVKASCSPLAPKTYSGLHFCNHLPTSKPHFFIEVIVFKRAVCC